MALRLAVDSWWSIRSLPISKPQWSPLSLTDMASPPLTSHSSAAEIEVTDDGHGRLEVMSMIESIFEDITNYILMEESKVIVRLRSRGQTKHCRLDFDSQSIRPVLASSWRKISFPGKVSSNANPIAKDAWNFTVLVRILQLMHEALDRNVIITKRDIYYKDPKLFGYQGIVDRYVDDIACTFGVERGCTNVVSARKGLVAGPLVIIRTDGASFECDSDSEGSSIPDVRDIREIFLGRVHWILVIEKEAIFRPLAASGFWKSVNDLGGAVITAKGYPDIATRAFLHRCASQESSREIPLQIFGLVDYDPDGAGILSTYKYGSAALAHENVRLNVPILRWIGVQSSDVLAVEKRAGEHGYMPLTARDRRRATNQLDTEVFGEDGPEPQWRREVQIMLLLNVKAEIEIMGSREGGFESWLEWKVAASLHPRAGYTSTASRSQTEEEETPISSLPRQDEQALKASPRPGVGRRTEPSSIFPTSFGCAPS